MRPPSPFRTHRLAAAHTLAAAALASLVLLGDRSARPSGSVAPHTEEPAPPEVTEPEQPTWSAAAALVEQDRGEPVGRRARVSVPPELRHYADTKRFLAVQVADWREHGFERPTDFMDLAVLVGTGEMVKVDLLGDHHILYGVGSKVTDEPFTVPVKGGRVPVFGSPEDVAAHDAALAEKEADLRSRVASQRQSAARLPRRLRRRATLLRRSATALERQARAVGEDRRRLAGAYADPETKAVLEDHHRVLVQVAAKIGPRPYDLRDRLDRIRFRARLLCTLRPPARDLMLELARGYAERFSRPLPVTSLIRTEEYQRLLSRTNPNATRIDVPPHTTGLAFDVFDGRMGAAEQQFLVDEVARLKRAGRVEALRENRDHLHIFVFADGEPPPRDKVIAEADRLRGRRPARSARGR